MSTRDGTLARDGTSKPDLQPPVLDGWRADPKGVLACLLARGEIHDLENWGMEYWEIGFFWNGSHSSPLTGIRPAPPVSLLKCWFIFLW